MNDNRRAPRSSDSQAWILRSRELLQHSADRLDGNARSRLNRARQAALAELDAVPASRTSLRWLAAAAITAGVALVAWRALWPDVLVSSAPATTETRIERPAPVIETPAPIELTPISAPDFELLADEQQFALIEELEFYAWLEAAEGSGG